MSAYLHGPESQYRDHFSEVWTLAEWNGHSRLAWFNSRALTAASSIMEVVRVSGLVSTMHDRPYVPIPGIPLPDWIAGQHTAIYEKWCIPSRMDPVEFSRDLPDLLPDDNHEEPFVRRNLKPTNSHYSPATIPIVCYQFGKHAPTMADLAYVTRSYAEWSWKYGIPSWRDVGSFPAAFLGNSLRLASAAGTYGDKDANPFVAEWARLCASHPAADYLRRKTVETLIDLLHSRELGPDKDIHKHINRRVLCEALCAFEEVGFVNADVWIGHGMIGGIAAKDPEFLAMLRSKLITEDGPLLTVGAGEYDPKFICRKYVTALLQHYADDPTRDKAVIGRLLEATMHKGRDTVSPEALITLANTLAQGWNARLPAGSPRYSQLSIRNPRDVSDALQRVLSISGIQDLSHEKRVEQARLDAMHVEVLGFLLDWLPPLKRSLNVPDLQLRYPHLGVVDAADVTAQLNAGVPLRETRMYTKKRRDLGIGRLRPGMHTPGSGLYS